MQDKDKTGADSEQWSQLKDNVQDLLQEIDEGHYGRATQLIDQISSDRDHMLYNEIGKLTRALHDAIVNFEIDSDKLERSAATNSKMANAQDRLDWVINLTQQSADKTMDMVEEGIPMASGIGSEAAELKAAWDQLDVSKLQSDAGRELYKRMDTFLGETITVSGSLGDKFNHILMAQDFQDLTSQVIQKVIALVQEVEDRLVELMRMAGQVEQITGSLDAAMNPEEGGEQSGLDTAVEGPQIHVEKREDVVSGQDEVDDLLSSLGF